MKKQALLAIFISLGFYTVTAQKFDGLAMTPPMGWNSWNTFQTKISEKLVMDIADLMVTSGMKDAGYSYIVLDDGWMTMERDGNGNLVPDPEKFPHGMKALADYVHSKGLKFGLYNCAGTKTCAGYPGTRGYEYQDARFYAAIGIDYLKFDWCYADGINAVEAYTTMSKALHAAGRPIVFSLCEWGTNKPWQWAKNVGHLWRTTGDISNCFEGTIDHGTWKSLCAMRIVEMEDSIRKYSGPGHWNDPDMMEVGNGMTAGEDRAHFSMWCMLAAPLIAGNDFRKMTPEAQKTLTNKEAIAVDQDALGIQGFRVSTKDSLETWARPLSNGSWAVCFLNRAAGTRSFSIDWKNQPVKDEVFSYQLDANTTTYTITDLWSKKNLGTTAKSLTVTVPSHDAVLMRLTK